MGSAFSPLEVAVPQNEVYPTFATFTAGDILVSVTTGLPSPLTLRASFTLVKCGAVSSEQSVASCAEPGEACARRCFSLSRGLASSSRHETD